MLDKDMISMRISNAQPTAIVATPEYFTRFGTPKAPEDLKHHRCLAFRYATSGVIHRWQFSRNDQTFIFDPPARFISNDNDMIVAAALDGIGIACILESQAIPHQKSGVLIRILKDWCPLIPPNYLYYPSRRHMKPALRALVDTISGISS
jgi:DNA-binding transcriptional LysR family regulator